MKHKLLLTTMLCLLLGFSAWAQGTVTGTITDDNGEPIPGASIRVVDTNLGTITDLDGIYTIEVPAGKTTLTFSFVGFETKQEEIGGRTKIDVTLSPSVSDLQEVVVTGAMGIEKDPRKLGYAVSTVDSKDILQSSPTNVASALYAKAPGVTISTNPGGATSAVAVQIRGLSSISYQQQPLLVVDGVISRNGDTNNDGYWSSPRIKGNGILDINPENIESINILKGAAASALYGSDAAAGVIVITTKDGGKSNGFGLDFNVSYGVEKVGVLPDVQNVFGPGYDRASNMSQGADENGWVEREVNGQTVQSPLFNAWGQFGPEMDGRDVYFWDGQIRPYVAYEDNMRNFYRTGHSGIYNVAISNGTEKSNYRLSYTRNDYKGVMEGGEQNKNTFNLNSKYQVAPKVNVDLVATYISEKVTNRPWMVDRMSNNYSGFLNPATDIRWFEEKYQTSKGYKYIPANGNLYDLSEAFALNTSGTPYMDYYWTQRARQFTENTNRLMGAMTVTYDILDNLTVRGRVGTDYTGYATENKEPNTVPLSVDNSGAYGTSQDQYRIFYGDVLVSYNASLGNGYDLNLRAGYQAREENYRYTSQNTQGGLTEENWFSMNASRQNPRGYSTRSYLVKDGLFAMASLDIKDYLFIETSLRQERTSTLYYDNNKFLYPSVSAAFELSKVASLPEFITYSKIRSSYGVVGNPAPAYQANVVYNAASIDGRPALYPLEQYGNNGLQNELKHEAEIGWENKFANNRLGLNLTYYQNTIKDMILPLQVPSSTGANTILSNVGNMKNYGLEVGLSATPVQTEDWMWDIQFNTGFNRNQVTTLMPGLETLIHSRPDNGSLQIVSQIGQPAGDILGYTLSRDENGKLLVGDDGFYIPDYDNLVKLGNVQPKAAGGFINNVGYKNFNLNAVIDYKWGGQVYSPSIQYMRSAGMLEETLFGRSEAYGGLPYYENADGEFVSAEGMSQGPNGESIYHDGMVMDGVTAEGEPNSTIVDAPNYYLNTYYWGSYPGSGLNGTYESAVFDNNYIKLRELVLSYTFPKVAVSKFKIQNLTVSGYGRNLFYIYKSLPHLDPEAAVGTNYLTRGGIGNGGAASRSYGFSIRASF
ncbi:SusC/RagA family TonB-linked outer membrane protein [Echinicola strongylocentroti]|uniref:SusC/RagA family TonB-linked outer membrane protein n=1 Tax=Echinicola strongylocentroti TaxID=1795355 RepID=A0A2Z4IQ22_9BACT|nr:SusC/RagA family TonB-linked outer membrane protein [Echinicola strongylocentroti]AWW32393.1 SusC/RagA family TonB-linked outer membrane protein [Echinicola strongylocentroti]